MNRPAHGSTFDPAQAAPLLLRLGHVGWLGLEYHSHGDDWTELVLPWRDDLLGDSERELLATGPIVSLCDMASGMAIWNAMARFVPIATLDLRVDYQRAARPRHAVHARARCYTLTRSSAFVTGTAHDGDSSDPVARFSGCFMRIDRPAVA
ncbi:PaaI family thioesterase [Erythrobacteraceae bacterium CFH 75059]|uniref:PaaI family thioesterase n=1 Tax=Qipengyuania thermophila TaxID=2509361 RepID=UPI001021694A|nr:PaaI family thioesterase [Qipengyuania thermophila]TCD04934.1 PaaI family thioesterase [Erythrobacteraceae bacterium CFH 75059]